MPVPVDKNQFHVSQSSPRLIHFCVADLHHGKQVFPSSGRYMRLALRLQRHHHSSPTGLGRVGAVSTVSGRLWRVASAFTAVSAVWAPAV